LLFLVLLLVLTFLKLLLLSAGRPALAWCGAPPWLTPDEVLLYETAALPNAPELPPNCGLVPAASHAPI